MATETIRQPAAVGARRWPRLSQARAEELTAYLFISPWIFGFLVFTAGAMIASFYISLLDTDLLSTSKFVAFRNYAAMFQAALFGQALKATFFYTILVVPLGTVVALSVAMLLNQKVRPLGFWRTVYYLPAVVSGVAVALLWGWVLNPQYGLVNLFLGLFKIPGPRWFASEQWAVPGIVLIALWGAGTSMLLYLAGLQSIPTELQEAARIDGAGPWQVFFNVTLPLLTPTVFFNVITGVIASFQVFTQAYILTQGGPNNATLFMVLYLYKQGFQQFHFGYASAVAWALFVIIMFFTLIVVRSSSYWVHYEGGLRR